MRFGLSLKTYTQVISHLVSWDNLRVTIKYTREDQDYKVSIYMLAKYSAIPCNDIIACFIDHFVHKVKFFKKFAESLPDS